MPGVAPIVRQAERHLPGVHQEATQTAGDIERDAFGANAQHVPVAHLHLDPGGHARRQVHEPQGVAGQVQVVLLQPTGYTECRRRA